MLNEMFGLLVQIAGFILLCRLGGRVADNLATRSKWLPLALGAPVIVALSIIVLVYHPVLTPAVQTLGFWLLGFAGALIVRARQLVITE